MNTFESIVLLVAAYFGVGSWLNHRRLKKRFDIIEAMLAHKHILTFDETSWENLPNNIKGNINEQNKWL
ncbi:MAG: hypothetical protein AAB424_03905 [Patescibacteria group bacterium]